MFGHIYNAETEFLRVGEPRQSLSRMRAVPRVCANFFYLDARFQHEHVCPLQRGPGQPSHRKLQRVHRQLRRRPPHGATGRANLHALAREAKDEGGTVEGKELLRDNADGCRAQLERILDTAAQPMTDT